MEEESFDFYGRRLDFFL